jgi:hypothetical protein
MILLLEFLCRTGLHPNLSSSALSMS